MHSCRNLNVVVFLSFRKMFIGGLSWQTTPGRFISNHLEAEINKNCWLFVFRKFKKLFYWIRWSCRMHDYERCNYKTVKVTSLSLRFIIIIIISSSVLHRGFGFITFKEANSVDKVLAKDVHTLDDKQVWNEQKKQRSVHLLFLNISR